MSGKTGQSIWYVVGEGINHYLGTTADGQGDINGDGYNDILLSVPGAKKLTMNGYVTAGKVYVYSGR
jgi:hypothetical protein